MSKEANTTKHDAGEISTGNNSQDGQGAETVTVSKSELDELRSAVANLENVNNSNARLKSKLKSFEEKAKEQEKQAQEKAEKEGDHQKTIEFLKKEKGRLEDQLGTLNSQLDSIVIDSYLISTAVKLGCTKPEVFAQLMRPNFERGEGDNGQPGAKLKGPMAGATTNESFLQKELDDRFPEWKKNPRAEGTGAQSRPDSKDGKSNLSEADLDKMTPRERVEALAKDPELARRVLHGGR